VEITPPSISNHFCYGTVASLYGFAFTESALKYLETTMPVKIRGQIKRRIEALAANPTPSGSKKLHGVTDGGHPVYRVRQGDYRILYSVRPIIIVILDIGIERTCIDESRAA
jgi:mRNA-degrading endonuclease RelE of RelBE toxin-antitoxin system